MAGQCIICREETDTFSDEHVIPKALGGYYHIYNVCVSCNSDLGSYVDSKLVNHQFADFQRYILGLRGNSKTLPNPFSGTHRLATDETQKIQLRLGENDKPAPYMIPKVTYEEIASKEGGTKVTICLDASDEKKIDGILAKISKKLKVSLDEFEGIDRTVQPAEHPSIKCSLSIDLADFKIGLLKVAYEFAVDSISEYFLDEKAIEISTILKSADYSSVEKYVNLGNGFDYTIFNSLGDYLDLESKKHYLVLASSTTNGLTCLIHLHGMFSAGVTLSAAAYPDDLAIFGVNDLEAKTFRKIYPEDLLAEIYAPPELRFQYFFETEQAVQDFLSLQASEDFDFYRQDNACQVFDRTGKQLESNLHDKMKEVECFVSTEALKGGGVAHTFPFQAEIFIKFLPSEKLVQIVAVREERYQVAKL